MSGHTKGPWGVRQHPYGQGNRRDIFCVATNMRLARVDHETSVEVSDSNAALISSAPDLLEALEAFKEWAIHSGQFDKTDGCYSKAIAALKKAKP